MHYILDVFLLMDNAAAYYLHNKAVIVSQQL